MVDIIMHKQLNLNAYPQSEEREERIPLSSLSKTEKPCPGFFLLLPSKVMGFSMQTKRWGKMIFLIICDRTMLIFIFSLSQSGLHITCGLEYAGF
jgi:hypothetical protein